MQQNRRFQYLLVGIWNSVFGLSIFFLLDYTLGQERHQLALFSSYVVAILQAHFTQRKLVWASKAEYLPELARFSSAYLFQYVMNVVLLFISVEQLKFSIAISQTIIVLFLTVTFYFVNQKTVFKFQGTKDEI
jgi:putative flippase GtrA